MAILCESKSRSRTRRIWNLLPKGRNRSSYMYRFWGREEKCTEIALTFHFDGTTHVITYRQSSYSTKFPRNFHISYKSWLTSILEKPSKPPPHPIHHSLMSCANFHILAGIRKVVHKFEGKFIHVFCNYTTPFVCQNIGSFGRWSGTYDFLYIYISRCWAVIPSQK